MKVLIVPDSNNPEQQPVGEWHTQGDIPHKSEEVCLLHGDGTSTTYRVTRVCWRAWSYKAEGWKAEADNKDVDSVTLYVQERNERAEVAPEGLPSAPLVYPYDPDCQCPHCGDDW